MNRIFNFSAGPAQLPLEVLREAQEELLDYRGTGMSVMEMSHRGKEFGKIISERFRRFLPNTRFCFYRAADTRNLQWRR